MMRALSRFFSRLRQPHAESRWRHLPWLAVGVVGGVFLEAYRNPAPLTRNFSLGNATIAYLPGAVAGAIIGYLLELLRDATRVANELAKLNDGFLKYLKRAFEQRPYTLLVDGATQFTGVVGALLRESLKHGYNRIANMREQQYLERLQEAIVASDTFFGIQRHPVSWFFSPAVGKVAPSGLLAQDTDASRAKYLAALRNRTMTSKVRVFVISEEEEQQMRMDVNNRALMARYWTETGRDVRTFWVTEQLLQEHRAFPGRLINSALYNNALVIRYDEVREIVEFDLVDGSEPEHGVRTLLEEQLNARATEPFSELHPPAVVEPTVPDRLLAYARKQDAYEELPTLLTPGLVRRIDMLQFSGQTAAPLLGKLARTYPSASIRLALLDPEMADKFAPPHDVGSESARIRATMVTVRALWKDRRTKPESAPSAGDIEVRFYHILLPSVSAVLIDDGIVSVSWYRQVPNLDTAAHELRGHDSPAITATGSSAEKLRSLAREQLFEVIWAIARPVPLDDTPRSVSAVPPQMV